MERIDIHQKKRPPRLGNRLWIGAVLTSGLLALGTDAHARTEQIPPPVETPEPGDSPGTGEPAPTDPTEPEVIPPPGDLGCIEGADQSICDPGHPDDQPPGNTPSPEWFNDMSARMYYLQESLHDLATWASGQDLYIYYYSTWMKSVVQQYYALAYDAPGEPHQYPYGPMTRGDFNYVYFYWVRVIYFSLLHYSAEYHDSHQGSPQIPQYRALLGNVSATYHPLVLCNYGFNGDDQGAREDLTARAAEAAAGLE